MKIVVRMPNWIGDFVMALPILEDLKTKYPNSYLVVICKGGLDQLLISNPFVNEIYRIDKRRFSKLRLILYLMKNTFDLGFLLTNSFSSALYFFFGRVKKRYGFIHAFRSFLLSHPKPFPKDRDRKHLVLTYKDLIDSKSQTTPKLYLKPNERRIGKTIFGINPSAHYGSAKCWPKERFREVIERLIKEVPNSEVLVFGDASSFELVNDICKSAPKEVTNLCGKTTLKELVEIIGTLDVFLTNDSGPMHIAASMQVPMVAIFGSTSPIITGPYQFGTVIKKNAACSPCFKRKCPIDLRCMTEISVDEVVKAMKKELLHDAMREKIQPLNLAHAKSPSVSDEPSKTEKRKGLIILGAGMGRRLGFSGPKGLVPIGEKTLYELLIENGKDRVAIMTSPATFLETKNFLESKGLNHVDLFQERCLPRLSLTYEESPEGNGAIFSTFYGSSLWDKWSDIDEFEILPIDNPKAKAPSLGDSELAIVAIEKNSPEESVGVLVEINDRVFVSEYSEIPEEEKVRWNLAYSGIFTCSKPFFEKAAKHKLPWHPVVRNGVKHFETYVFDSFPLAKDYKIILKDRNQAFKPIKTKDDLVKYLHEVKL
jgi:heptosyltransferase-2